MAWQRETAERPLGYWGVGKSEERLKHLQLLPSFFFDIFMRVFSVINLGFRGGMEIGEEGTWE